ncbi:MAG: IS4 family transposase [Deinococcus sp.]|nr:IS4 family transposase [Deinococcus sp.]
MDPFLLAGRPPVEVISKKEESLPSEAPVGQVPSAAQWAAQQFGQVDLGDKRLNQRAVEMAVKMAAYPEASLPNQMGSRTALVGAYRLFNNETVTVEALLAPHCQQTLAAAALFPVVLMAEDTSELDYTAHPSTTGLGPIGDGKGRGLLLHSTLAIVPEGRGVLGLAHAQIVLREPKAKGGLHWKRTPEAQVWEVSAQAVGRPPEGSIWVHVSDRGSDIFEYMVACVDLGKHFLVRAFHNRVLSWEEGAPQAEEEEARHLLDYARSLLPCSEPEASYTVRVPATKKQPAREARVVMQWSEVTIAPPTQAPLEVRCHAPIKLSILRVWEPDPPQGAERVEWILLSSLPITTVEEALRAVDWYTCRWLCEDYHQCLKTGCRVEHTQLDEGVDICRLLGFAIPIAVRLLQLRQAARQTPDPPAKVVVEPLMVEVLAQRQKKDAESMTIGEFWRSVAQMGGHQGRRRDGPPGWRTVWKGWRYLSDLTEGARLYAKATFPSNTCSV